MQSKGIVAAETKDSPKKPAKVLAHLELHPKLGGGSIVKHVYTSYQHDSQEVHFNKAGTAKGGEHVVAHLIKHGGLPAQSSNTGASEEEEEEEV